MSFRFKTGKKFCYINLVLVYSFLLIPIYVSCSGLKTSKSKAAEEDDDNPKSHNYKYTGSCSYAKEILEELKKDPEQFSTRDQEYKGFLFFDVQYHGIFYGCHHGAYQHNVEVSEKHKFYPVSYTNEYSEEDLQELKRLEDAKESIKLPENNNVGDCREYNKKAYNFVDKGNGHCDVDVYAGGMIRTFSDIKEDLTLKKLIKKGCEDKLEFIPIGEEDLIVRSSEKDCFILNNGVVRTGFWYPVIPGPTTIYTNECNSNSKYWVLSDKNDSYVPQGYKNKDVELNKEYYLNSVISGVVEYECSEKKIHKLSQIMKKECLDNVDKVKVIEREVNNKYLSEVELFFKKTQDLNDCFVSGIKYSDFWIDESSNVNSVKLDGDDGYSSGSLNYVEADKNEVFDKYIIGLIDTVYAK